MTPASVSNSATSPRQGACEPRPHVWAPRPAAAAARPSPGPDAAVGWAGPGAPASPPLGGDLAGGEAAAPSFVQSGVRAVPRAGQQCVNKPTATSAPRRSPRARRRRRRLASARPPAGRPPPPRPRLCGPAPPPPARAPSAASPRALAAHAPRGPAHCGVRERGDAPGPGGRSARRGLGKVQPSAPPPGGGARAPGAGPAAAGPSRPVLPSGQPRGEGPGGGAAARRSHFLPAGAAVTVALPSCRPRSEGPVRRVEEADAACDARGFPTGTAPATRTGFQLRLALRARSGA